MANERESGGILGGVIAAFLSWHSWHSIGWAIIHSLLGWIYVIYWILVIWDRKW